MKRIFELGLVVPFICYALVACNDDVEFQGQVLPPQQEQPEEPVTPPLLFQETFPSSSNLWVEASYDFQAQTITQPLRLDEATTLTATFTQATREQHAESWVQGHEGTLVEDSFMMSSGVLDLAIIVDDSDSMAKEHEDLAERLDDLLSEIDGVDWQMAIATTTSSCLRPDGTTIFASDADYETRFGDAVDAGIGGSGDEKGLERGAELLQGVCEGEETKPWIRDDSLVAVLFVSDENSYCGLSCSGNELPNKFVADMKKIRPGQQDLLRAYALTWNATDCTKDSSESEGTRYRDVVDKIGGLTLPICKDFSDVLRQISVDVASVLERKFTLKHIPAPGSLKITIGGQPYTDYTLVGSEISMGAMPAGPQTVEVSYRHSPVAKTDSFLLTKSAAADSLYVTVNGSEVEATEYTFDAATNMLVLNAMPADNAMIVVNYRVGQALPAAFSLAQIQDLRNITSVTVDGEELGSTEYVHDAALNEVQFVQAPPDGSNIQVIYANEDLRSQYPLSVGRQNAVEYVKARDRSQGDEFVIEYDGENVLIPASELRSGRELDIVFFYNVDTWLPDFDLPLSVVEDSLVVMAGNELCQHTFSDQGALMVSCEDSATSIVVGYEIFELTSDLKLAQSYPDSAVFEVTVGDTPIAFQRKGDTLQLLDDVPANAEVLVSILIPTE